MGAITNQEVAKGIINQLEAGEAPADLYRGLYQTALRWAGEEGAIDLEEYAGATAAKIWGLVEEETGKYARCSLCGTLLEFLETGAAWYLCAIHEGSAAAEKRGFTHNNHEV